LTAACFPRCEGGGKATRNPRHTLTVTKPIFDGLYRREGLLDREPV
jgi:hypothetical protein